MSRLDLFIPRKLGGFRFLPLTLAGWKSSGAVISALCSIGQTLSCELRAVIG